MRILVLGGTGNTGERMVRRLLAAGHTVRLLSRQEEKAPAVAALMQAGADLYRGDCIRRWTLWQALEDCEALISCAHVRHADACVQACQKFDVRRYIQLSSTRRFTRIDCASSREVIAGERVIEASSLEWTILRPTMIFGGAHDRNVERLTAWFARRSWFPLFGDGHHLVQPVFVEDVSEAVTRSLERPAETRGRALNLAGPEAMSYRRFLESIARSCGVKRPRFVRVPIPLAIAGVRLLPRALADWGLSVEQIRRFGEDKDVSISDAREALNFKPRQFEEALQRHAASKHPPNANSVQKEKGGLAGPPGS